MNRVGFDAFALPAGVSIRGGPPSSMPFLDYEEQGLRVRYLEATPDWVSSVADALRGARDALATREAGDIAAVLGRCGSRFLDPADPVRAEALRLLPPTAGLSEEMAVAVLDGMAADWTEARLLGLLRAELGAERVLDGFVAATSRPGGATDHAAMAVGPSLCVQIVAGSVPGVGVTALLRSLLLKGPTLLKPGRGDVVLPVLFARALREADPGLADALAVVYWQGGERSLEDASLARADVVTVYGSDETVSDLRARTPVTARFVAYHHRVSVGIVGREALTRDMLDGATAEVAESVAYFDQRGCVSPQIIFVEEAPAGSGAATPAAFAEALAVQLSVLEARLPSGDLEVHEVSELHQLRGTSEFLAATGEATLIHGGEASWTVILEPRASPPASCVGRLVRVRAVSNAAEVPGLLAPLGPHLQTVGVAGLGERLVDTAQALGRVGASRVVPFRSVAFPPPWWHHDGRGPLLDLVRWVDLEGE